MPAAKPVVIFIGGTFVPAAFARHLYGRVARDCHADQITALSVSGFASLEHSYAGVATAISAAAPSGPLVLIGHSQGALHAVRFAASSRRVRRVISLSGPHHGTRLAAAGRPLGSLLPGLRQMHPDDPYMKGYMRLLPKVAVRLTSIYLTHEALIIPSHSAHVAGAHNVELGGFTTHLTELFSRSVQSAVSAAAA